MIKILYAEVGISPLGKIAIQGNCFLNTIIIIDYICILWLPHSYVQMLNTLHYCMYVGWTFQHRNSFRKKSSLFKTIIL